MASTTHAPNTPTAINLTILWQPYVSVCVGYNEEGGFTIGVSRNGEPMESKEDAFKFANQMMEQIPEAVFASVRRVEVLK